MNVIIKTPDGDLQRSNVSTWWYDGTELIIEYTDGDTEPIPFGDVMERLL